MSAQQIGVSGVVDGELDGFDLRWSLNHAMMIANNY